MKYASIVIALLAVLSNAQTGARYLIITHDDYYEAIRPLAEWKTEKGLKSKIVRLSETGSDSTQIRNYIRNAYTTWEIKPEYALLVGNDTEIRQVRYTHPLGDVYTDNYYTNMTGDFKNEILPGRLWVYDTTHVKTIVAKILAYERDPWRQDTLWFQRGVTIVNEDEDSLPADSVYWSDARYAHGLMRLAGFNSIDSLAQSFGHDSMDVLDAWNQGCSYIIYRGVGFYVWDWPFMGIWYDLINNGWKTPIVISATCGTVEGIGYTWLYLGTPDQPCGTAGFFGTTTALYHAAEFRSALARGTLNGIFNDQQCTMGIAAEYGRQMYTTIFNDSLEYNSWTCLGDPDMRLWTAVPRVITVSHDTILWTGISPDTLRIQVHAGPVRIDSALVCIMADRDTTLYHYGYTDVQGEIIFIDTLSVPGDSLHVTVTGRNLLPYRASIPVHHSGGAHIELLRFALNDSAGGNGDGIANPGEDVEVPVWLMNWGDSTAYGIATHLTYAQPDTFTMLYDTVISFDSIPSLDSVYSSSNAYNIVIAPTCPDSHFVDLHLIITDTTAASWISDFQVDIHAPVIEYVDHTFPGTYKYMPLGDTATLLVTIMNTGTYGADTVTALLRSSDTALVVIDSIAVFGIVAPDSYRTNETNPFVLLAHTQLVPGTEIPLSCEVRSGVYVDSFFFSIYAGQRDYLIWDPDLNNSSGPVIHNALATLRFNGDYTSDTLPGNHHLSIYKSLFACLGVYPYNYVVVDNSGEGSAILQYLEVFNGKVYMEGGDVWYADPHYNHGFFFYPLFEIDPVSTSVGPLSHLDGCDSAFTSSMGFSYTGESNSIDRIENEVMGTRIFKKTENAFGTGVAAFHRTVGISFELGALEDSVTPSTRIVLLDSIMRYFGIIPTGLLEYAHNDRFESPFMDIRPNPGRGQVHISYSPGHNTQDVRMRIYDITGRLVKSLDPCDPVGTVSSLRWDGTDDLNRLVSQGIYFVRLTADGQTIIRKIVLLR